MSITRMGTANLYDRTINNISKQQAELASQMEHASAGKKIIRASDDPVGAAQAERARTRLSRMETDQRMLDAQTATIKYGESTLGEISTAVQEFRSLIVNAGNGAFNQTQRDTLVEQLQSLRDQILTYSNRKDSNGLPLFRGLDTFGSNPFPNAAQGIQAGQANANEYTITNTLNGALAFFGGSTGNGVLAVDIGANNKGAAWADVGVIKDPSLATTLASPLSVEVVFGTGNDGEPTYALFSVDSDANTRTPVPLSDLNGAPMLDELGDPVYSAKYVAGAGMLVQGMALTISGAPKSGDTFTVKPSEALSMFSALDQAIAVVKKSGNLDGSTDHGALAHGLAKSLAEIDTQLNRVSTVRGVAGDLLNQAERMGTTLLAHGEQLEAQRSAAEDVDMVAALSQLQTQQTAVSVALQSYASIQKLSLFEYIR